MLFQHAHELAHPFAVHAACLVSFRSGKLLLEESRFGLIADGKNVLPASLGFVQEDGNTRADTQRCPAARVIALGI